MFILMMKATSCDDGTEDGPPKRPQVNTSLDALRLNTDQAGEWAIYSSTCCRQLPPIHRETAARSRSPSLISQVHLTQFFFY